MGRIPNIYHFTFGFAPDFGGIPFGLLHYLAIASCKAINQPDEIFLYYDYEPSGIWWERAKAHVTLCKVNPRREIGGALIRHPAHVSDVFRLETLLNRGGIYLDLDVICVRPFGQLREYAMVMGEEQGVGLCNAVILSEPRSSFVARWLDEYRSFKNESWNAHSVVLPARLADEVPEEIRVLGPRSFFWPMHRPHEVRQFLLGTDRDMCAESYCFHLWQHLFWDDYLAHLTPAHLTFGDSEFCHLTRAHLGGVDSRDFGLRFALGATGWRRDGFLTVGPGDYVNVHCDYPHLDRFIPTDEGVDEFVVTQSVALMAAEGRTQLFRDMHRKLKRDGCVTLAPASGCDSATRELARELALAGFSLPAEIAGACRKT